MSNVASSFTVPLLVGFIFISWVLAVPQPAEACCTDLICPWCHDGSLACVCGPKMPVCNIVGCNCNEICGQYTNLGPGKCRFIARCNFDSASLVAKERFDEIDTDHDGRITLEETKSWYQAKKLKPTYRNGSPPSAAGERPELDENLRSGFELADTDGNGFVTPEEFDSSLGTSREAEPAGPIPDAAPTGSVQLCQQDDAT